MEITNNDKDLDINNNIDMSIITMPRRKKSSFDVIGSYIHRVDKSKTRKLMNLFYSLVFGYFSSHYLAPKNKYKHFIAIVIALVAFIISRKGFSKSSDKPEQK